MAFIDNYVSATQDQRVIAQVTAAILTYAEQVYSSDANPDNRQSIFASKVSLGQLNLGALIQSAVSFANLSAASSDTTVSNAVATLWPMWSGA
jgi:hypothetical protein